MSFIFQCPYCKNQFTAQDEWTGKNAECPVCHHQVMIQPAPQLQPAPQPQSAPQPQANQSLKTGRSATTYVLLGIFLGWMGAHDFYAGNTQMGTIKAIIGGLGFLFGFATCFITWILPMGTHIWAIVDICITKEDADGVPFEK